MIPLRIKPGVRLTELKPQILIAVNVAQATYEEVGADEMVLTSVRDGEHGEKSLHSLGYCIDIRTRDLPNNAKIIAHELIADRLGEEFDVILEPTHLHIEYDPRGLPL